ncbi:MAG: hypothetical protein LUG98_09390 [Tannerellaceae bacterium]|nr:hypothetical protein [Tannerellaceae bacterium]
MKATYFLPMLIAGLLFSSCSDNDPGDIDIGAGTGQEATIKFTFKMPPSPIGSRATIPGNTVENDIVGVKIYVYDQAGNPPTDPDKAAFGPYDLNDTNLFNKKADDVYEMVTPITTTDGIKHIYVVANTNITAETAPTEPENNLGTFDTENRLLTRDFNVHKGTTGPGLINYDAATPPVMTQIVFAGNEKAELKPASQEIVNEVQVNIERTVSRVITTCPDPQEFKGDWTTGNEYTLSIINFLVKQDAYKGVVGQNYYAAPDATRKKTLISDTDEAGWYNIIRAYDPDYYLPVGSGPPANDIDVDYVEIGADPGTNSGRIDLPGFYFGENVTNTPNNVAQHGNTTYAWIQARLALQSTAVVNGNAIEYTGTGLTGTQTFHLVRVKGVRDFICLPANSGDVARLLHGQYEGDVATYEYPFGYIYYRIFLNGVDEYGNPLPDDDKYNVYRNQFIHLDIIDVKMSGEPGTPGDPTAPGGPGGFGPGYPGNPPTDPNNPEDPGPKVPIDPFTPPILNPEDPTKPGEGPGNNPNPHNPKDPIDENDATLKVNIFIKPWEYTPNGIIL